jgi:fucose 4-O-acetylase-like acetyltransferase
MKRSQHPSSAGLDAIVEATGEDRDRYVDFLRALSIGVVVLGHWLMAAVYQRGGSLTGENALDAVPGLWLATWLLQVMPLFFFVGGFSNSVSWKSITRRGDGYRDFLRSRIERLMRPTLVFIGVWTTVAFSLSLLAPEFMRSIGAATELIAKPLWFLAVYVLVTALSPAMLAVHERYRVRAIVALIAGAAVCDVARVGFGLTLVGYLNFAFVWLLAHQLGFFYADGTFERASRAFFVRIAGFGLSGLVILTSSGIYSPSMVGADANGASNNSPPSVCLIALTFWLVGLAMTFRAPVTSWLKSRGPWKAVVAANSMIMTVFLWHLTAVLLAVLFLYPAGFPQPQAGTAVWWTWRPVWLIALVVFLVPLVAVFGRFERAALTARTRPRERGARDARSRRVVVGTALLVAGLAGLAQYGFEVSLGADSAVSAIPLMSAVSAGLGHRLLTADNRLEIGG